MLYFQLTVCILATVALVLGEPPVPSSQYLPSNQYGPPSNQYGPPSQTTAVIRPNNQYGAPRPGGNYLPPGQGDRNGEDDQSVSVFIFHFYV